MKENSTMIYVNPKINPFRHSCMLLAGIQFLLTRGLPTKAFGNDAL